MFDQPVRSNWPKCQGTQRIDTQIENIRRTDNPNSQHRKGFTKNGIYGKICGHY